MRCNTAEQGMVFRPTKHHILKPVALSTCCSSVLSVIPKVLLLLPELTADQYVDVDAYQATVHNTGLMWPDFEQSHCS